MLTKILSGKKKSNAYDKHRECHQTYLADFMIPRAKLTMFQFEG